jgi:2-keto-4-pentenoate hydratase/2-oxohepta-3-ene-1,7-dioic acid hydratase in catechol pathway
MIFLMFQTSRGLSLGIKTSQGILDVAAAQAVFPSVSGQVAPDTLLHVGMALVPSLAELTKRAKELPALFHDELSLSLGPVTPHPGKIICIGLNYRRHAAEAGMPIPSFPVLFSKFTNALAASGQRIPLPSNAREYDYEAELGVVMGRQARYIEEQEALDYILGYCTANDLSARDLQSRTTQWLLGKTLDAFLPIGPYLVTADEIGEPQGLGVRCWVNGELRQNSTTADMIFPVASLVSYMSQYMTLEPGDVLLTGTPEGVILGMQQKAWLKPGDEVIAEVEGLGRLTNVMAYEGVPSR